MKIWGPAFGLFIFVLPLSVAAALSLVNINTAGLSQLETLSGIGAVKAQAIIDYRTQNGPFASIDQIQNVSGIGASTYAKIKDSITVSDSGSTSQSTVQQNQTPDQTATSSQEAPSASAVSSYVAPPTPDLYANAGADRTVIAGADVEFDASAYDKDQHTLDTSTTRFSWNFGDGTTAEGQAVLHHFTYPGRYDVVLTIAQNKEAVADDLIVTAEPAALGFLLLPDSGVAIENRAGHDLDLSNWIVKEDSGLFSAQFMLPDHSKILAGSSMNISVQTLQFHASSSTILEYPNGTAALTMGEATRSNAQTETTTQDAAPAMAGAAPVASVRRVHTIAAPEVSVPEAPSQPEESAQGSTTLEQQQRPVHPHRNTSGGLVSLRSPAQRHLRLPPQRTSRKASGISLKIPVIECTLQQCMEKRSS